MERDHLEQAKFWLMEAKHLLQTPEESVNKNTVVCALAIHSMIKANDALTMKFLGKTARRHDEAVVLFTNLIKTGKIEQSYAGLRRTLEKMIKKKAAADYRSAYFGKKDAVTYVRNAEKFFKMAEKKVIRG